MVISDLKLTSTIDENDHNRLTFIIDKGQLDVFAKSARVVVHERGGVAKCFEKWIHLQYLQFQTRVAQTQVDEMFDEMLGGLGLSRARLATDDAALRFVQIALETLIGIVGQSVDMWRCCLSRGIRVELVMLRN